MIPPIVPAGRRARPAAAWLAACLLLLGFLPSPLSAADPAPFGSSIAVDFSAIQRAIPALLFGQNLQPIDRGEGIIGADGSVDAEILGLAGEARVTSLRYPAGTAADYFHWWQAVGLHSRRPQQSTGYLGSFYSPVAGPDEFIRIAIALRAVPFITANTGTGSADEAAALARFFKARGFPVVFWEVGNEIYFEGVGEGGLVGLPPNVYANRVIQYAAAIRQEMPAAKVFAAAVIGPEESDSYWNAVVLGLAGSFIDGISVHNAYFPLYGYRPDRTVPPDEVLYRAMLGATAAVDRSLGVLERQLDRLGRLIPIFITEYEGIFFPDPTIEDPALTVRRNPTLACALFDASVLQILIRHERVQGAHHMSLAGERFGSLVGVDQGVRFRNPQFYVHHEYAKEAGNLLVKSVVEPGNAVFDSEPIRLLSPQHNVPMLDAIATRDPGDTNYALFVVNRSLDQPVSAMISTNLPAGVTGTLSVLSGPSYAARNNAANPQRVALTTAAFAGGGAFTYSFPPASLTIFRWHR
ncbi:MAG TPA: alpha-L-arabinofuranosidase C-terminal domain-containing protein [Thermoanaerobaculia bacterium]|nr:alpha-L-arabinofuranosidase C-terminal domain-containing protein [Thermoanaerobaculia bacterium]